MPRKQLLKIVANTSEPDRREWTVLVELDRETLNQLTSSTDYKPPRPGAVFDIGPVLERLEDLETRESQVQKFRELLGKIAPQAEPEESH